MSDRIYLGTRKGLFRVDRSGGVWQITGISFLGDTVSMMLPDRRDGTVHVALYHGHFGVKMHRSRDEGQTWEETPAPAYPPKPEGEEDRDGWGKPIPWKLVQVWSLAAGLADQPGLLWCGSIPGGLFRSTDSGSSWGLVTSLWNHPSRKQWFGGGADLPGLHSVCVHPGDGRHVGVGVSCGGYWLTTDGGETWNCRADGMRADYMPPERKFDPNIQDCHCVVQCPSAPDHLWAQHHNGIFRSTDGAATWHEVENATPSNFGFAVAVHPQDPNTAWFVPAIKDEKRIPVDGRVVVTRTRDGGRSFDLLTRGLPQEHAYDLTFRHALAVDETGNRIVFGSTTGSCWISEDQGDSWRCLSSNLPPIYCVRFH
jgi:hypothetical protein